jgi:uncharacterized damage-inducible protein DinB
LNNLIEIQTPQAVCLRLITQNLQNLQKEIEAFQEESGLRKVLPGISNSAGNLCLHICGNLQHFVGAILGKTGYERNREAEFLSKTITQEALLKEIQATQVVMQEVIPFLSELDWEKEYPIQVFQEPMLTGYFLMHLSMHLSYHLGQINYLRRIMEGSGKMA